MLRNKPKLGYCGITIVLANPSRFDVPNLKLLTATGGTCLSNYCLQPEYNQFQCDVRLMEDKSPWLEGTKAIMLLGEAAMHHYCPKTRGNTLNEMRGSPLYVDGIPAIASYFPQDAADRKDHEGSLNQLSKDYHGDDDDDDEDNEDIKRFSGTKIQNYAFWLRCDTEKVKRLLASGTDKWPVEQQPEYVIYPTADVVINALNVQGQTIDFDIETDYEDANLLCFSFSVDGRSVYCVPILDYNYRWAYTEVPRILCALGRACRTNTLVAHNGASFDFPVLGYKYRIAVSRPYDTMIAMHRCFPDVEKSLGHCTSLWTYQTFHKDSDSRAYRTYDYMMQKLKYCGKDVFTMRLIRESITRYAKTVPGLPESIALAQRSIVPYLTTTLQGIPYSKAMLDHVVWDNDRAMEQYIRIISLLIGESGMAEVRQGVKGKAKAFPGSNSQTVKYFHDILGYKVMRRGKPNKDGFKKPSLAKTAMYKLAAQYHNPVINFTLLYRGLQKETGSLKFIPWKWDNGQIVNRDKYSDEKIELSQPQLV